MEFKVLGELYICCALFFIKSKVSDVTDEVIIKQLGVSKIKQLTSKAAILDDDLWPKVSVFNDNDWVCILDDFYGLCNLHWDNPNRKLVFQKLSKAIGDVMIMGTFSEVVDAFTFEYFKNGKQIRDIDCETFDYRDKSVFNIKETGDGERLKELPKILDFDKRSEYIKTVAANFGITLPKDISHGRFYSIA